MKSVEREKRTEMEVRHINTRLSKTGINISIHTLNPFFLQGHKMNNDHLNHDQVELH